MPALPLVASPQGAPSAWSHEHPELSRANYLVLHQFPSPEVERLWRDMLHRADAPSGLITPDYLGRRESPRHFAVLALNHGAVTGVVTGLHLEKHVICGLPARPQICAESTDVEITNHALCEGLLAEAKDASLIDVFTWGWRQLSNFEQHGFKPRQVEANVVLDLTVGSRSLYKQFSNSRKRNIREAEKHGIEVFQATTEEDAAAFYSVCSAWKQTERKTIHSKLTLPAINQLVKLKGIYRIFLARYEGKVIAGSTVRFYPGGLAEYANNSSLDESIKLRPNDLLLWRSIEWACEQGCKKYSLGGSHPFLRRSGGIVVPIYRYRLDRTFLHRNHLKDSVKDICRNVLRRLPEPAEAMIKSALHKDYT